MEDRYESALGRARGLLKTAESLDYNMPQTACDIRTTVFDIFPGLREDHRGECIRKALLAHFRTLSYDLSVNGYSKEDFISWLEGLKEDALIDYIRRRRNEDGFYYNHGTASWEEMSPIDRMNDYPQYFKDGLDCYPFAVEKVELVYRMNGLMQEYIKAGKDKEEKEHRFKCYKLFWDALEDTEFFKKEEQETAEWNDTDMNEARQNLISVCRDWEQGRNTTLLPVVAARARYFLEQYIKPGLLSELTWQDIVSLEETINEVHYENRNGIGAESFGKEVLEKFYNKKGIYHRDEWSAEDEEICLGIMTEIARAGLSLDEDRKNAGYNERLHKMYDWLNNRLKSLRRPLWSHWKPCGEQLETLRSVAETYAVGSPTRQRLDALYRDVKGLLDES